MYEIQFYNLRDNPRKLLESAYLDRRISVLEMLTEEEQKLVEQSWQERLRTHPEFKDLELGSLWNTYGGDLGFCPTKFKIYDAVTQHLPRGKNKIPYSEEVLEQLRTSAVGCALETADGFIVVQRRGSQVLAANKLDSSASGMVTTNGRTLDFKSHILNKLEEELGVGKTDLDYLVPTGIHRSTDYGTAQFTFAAKTSKPLGKILEDKDPQCTGEGTKRITAIYGVRLEDLPEYLIVNTRNGNMIGDGIATLLKSIGNLDIRDGVIQTLEEHVNIVSGYLFRGDFHEEFSIEPED